MVLDMTARTALREPLMKPKKDASRKQHTYRTYNSEVSVPIHSIHIKLNHMKPPISGIRRNIKQIPFRTGGDIVLYK